MLLYEYRVLYRRHVNLIQLFFFNLSCVMPIVNKIINLNTLITPFFDFHFLRRLNQRQGLKLHFSKHSFLSHAIIDSNLERTEANRAQSDKGVYVFVTPLSLHSSLSPLLLPLSIPPTADCLRSGLLRVTRGPDSCS